METKKLFEKYYARLRRVGILKSFICSGIIGFAGAFAVALTLWFFDPSVLEVILYSVGAGLVLTLLFVPLFYFKRFRPTSQGIARMIDRMGLDERIITMYELEKDESYIAMKQREDAQAKMGEVNEKQLKLKYSKVAIVFLILVGAIGIGMTTVSALGAHGIIDKEALNPLPPGLFDQTEYCEVNYVVYGFGMIDGEEAQLVEKGQDATPVVAIADDGYIFMGWDDGVETPDRWDRKVEDHIFVNAVFMPVSESEDGEAMQQPQDGESSEEQPEEDAAEDQPQDANPSDQEQDPSETPPDIDINDPSDNASGNPLYDNNTIIDGETDYTTEFEYDRNMEDLAGDDSLPPDLKDVIGGYYDTLKP